MLMSHVNVIARSCFFSFLIAAPAVLAQGLPGGGGPNGPVPGPTICYVDDNGSVTNDCTSWGDACSELQIALDKADQGDCEQIWVAAGSYRPDYDLIFGHVGSKSMTFQLLDGVEIYGGLAGTEGSSYNMDNRDLVTNETFLTGDLHGDDGPGDFEDYDNNSYHVVTGSGTDETALIDGFTIIGGNADDSPSHDTGAGMLIVEGAATVRQCKFELNSAENKGGGLSIEDTNELQNQPAVVDCQFVNNRTTDGGGGGVSLNDSSPSVIGCTFEGNQAFDGGGQEANGGGLLGAGLTAQVEITDCTFETNSSECSGGGAAISGEDLVLENCDFTNNHSDVGAGGLHLIGPAEIRGCDFEENTADGTGGALVASGVIVVNSRFEANQADDGADAILAGDVNLINSEFLDHSSSAILRSCAPVDVTNCLFVGNGTALDSTGSCTVLASPPRFQCGFTTCYATCVPDEDYNVVNSTFVDNTTGIVAFGDLEVYGSVLWNNSTTIDVDPSDDTCVVGYSDFSGQALPQDCQDAGTNTVIFSNPLFVNAGAGDYRLDEDSPCIDAGDNTQVPEDVADLDGDQDVTERTPLDLDGNPRFVDDPNTLDSGIADPPNYPEVVDMGAYEFQDE